MLKRLYVDNIRCFSNFEFTPDSVSVLVGPNGSGKSTVFNVLQQLRFFLRPNGTLVGEAFPHYSCTRWDSRRIQRVEVEVHPTGGEFLHYSLEIEHNEEEGGAVIRQERLTGGDQLLFASNRGEVQLFEDDANAPPKEFPVDPRRSFLPILEPKARMQRIGAFKDWWTRTALFKLKPEQLDPFSEAENVWVDIDGKNFVSWYRTLLQEHPETAGRIREDMKAVIPGLSSIRLMTSGDKKFLVVDCAVGGRTFSLTLADLSDGQRALLIWYTVLHALAPEATLLMLDEPDNYVSDREIQPWLARLRERMVDAGQGTLLVMSHHPEVIDYLAADQVLALSRTADGPARVGKVEVDRSAGLPASQWLRLGGYSDELQESTP